METVDLARLLLDLLIVVVAAKLAAEGAERIGVPAVLGEIVAGILVGPSALGLVELTGERGVSLGMLAEIGVLLLLVQVGMEMDLAELGRLGRASMSVAVIGVVVPFATGAAAGIGLGLGDRHGDLPRRRVDRDECRDHGARVRRPARPGDDRGPDRARGGGRRRRPRTDHPDRRRQGRDGGRRSRWASSTSTVLVARGLPGRLRGTRHPRRPPAAARRRSRARGPARR